MPLRRSLIDIDVNDESFRAFQALFEKYVTAVGRLPGQWNKVNETVDAQRSGFVEIASVLLAQQELLHRSNREVENIDRSTSRLKGTMQSLSRATREFSGNLLSATGTILRWTGVTGVVGSMIGLLSGAGIAHLAASGASTYRTSMGYAGPTTAAQVGAAGAYSGILDPRALLGQLTDMIQSGEGKRGLVSLGFGPGDWDKGAGALLPEFLRRLQGRAKGVIAGGGEGNFSEIMEGYGLGGQMDTARVLSRMTPEQLAELERNRLKNEQELARVTEDILFKWTNLSGKITVAETKIQSAFIIGLDKLQDPIGKVVEAFSNLVLHLGDSKAVKDLLENLATALGKVDFDKFAERLEAGAGKLYDFGTALSSVIIKLTGILSWLNDNTSLGADTAKGDAQRGALGGAGVGGIIGNWIGGPRGAAIGATIGGAIGAGVSMVTGSSRGPASKSNWTEPSPGTPSPGQSFNFSNPASTPGNVDPSIIRGIQFFEERGLTREQAIGVVMRLASESGGGVRLDPKAELKDATGGAYAIAQWRGPRQPAARATGGDLDKQLWLTWHEMTGESALVDKGAMQALESIKVAGSSADAARSMELFERAGNPDFTELAAQRAYRMSNILPRSGPLVPGSTSATPNKVETLPELGRIPALRSSQDIKDTIAKYSATEMKVAKHWGMLDSSGIPTFDPGTPVNSEGRVYSRELLTMSAAERATMEKRTAEWKAATQAHRTDFFPPPTDLENSLRPTVRLRQPSGIKVTVEHDVGGSAPSGAAQVAQ